ncbi:MAG: CPBP family intramembrane metalloprotease [Clostridia bacterium]|nr:CPBP family intramembrane metalloprotease [Clostridia bacterium]
MAKKKKEVAFTDTLTDELKIYDSCAILLGAFIVMLILQMLVSIVLTATKVDTRFRSSLAYVCIITGLNEIAFFTAPFIYGKIKSKRVWSDCGYKKKPSIEQAALSIGIAIATLCAFSPIATLFNAGITALGFEASVAISAATPVELICYIIFAAILPAICEEFLYRGHVARGLKSGGYIFGLLMSAAFFAFMHSSPVQLVYQFFMGAVCAVVYYCSRSIYPSIIVHFTSNFVVLIGDYIMTANGIHGIAITSVAGIVFAVLTVVGVPALLGLMYLFILRTAKREGKIDRLKEIKGWGLRSWSARLKLLHDTDAEIAARQDEEDRKASEIAMAATPEIRETLISKEEETIKRNKRISKRALMVTWAVILVLWIVNTIMGFIG